MTTDRRNSDDDRSESGHANLQTSMPETQLPETQLDGTQLHGTQSHGTPPAGWFSRLIREPLLHFLLLGAALFGLYGFLHSGDGNPVDDEQIVVTAGKIEHLATLFARTWQRPPTRQELEGLVNDYVREEAAYREGTAIGLDQNDTIIRRRIRQKLDFVADDLASQMQATEEDLENYLREHPDDFRKDSKFTFRQVFFSPERHGDDLAEIVNDLVVTLREDASVDAREQGDRTLLEFGYENVSQREVANLFGNQLASALADIEPGTWQGPIESSYGVHAVIVDELIPGSVPNLESARDAVRREVEHARQQELTEKYYQSLVDKYDVVIQWPDAEKS